MIRLASLLRSVPTVILLFLLLLLLLLPSLFGLPELKSPFPFLTDSLFFVRRVCVVLDLRSLASAAALASYE